MSNTDPRKREQEVQALLSKALEGADGKSIEAAYLADHTDLTRYANSEVHQPTLVQDAQVQIRVAVGKRLGSSSTNDLSDEGLRRCVQRAAEAAALTPEVEHFHGFARPSELPSGRESYSSSTALVSQERKAELVGQVFRKAAERDLEVAGSLSTAVVEKAIANTEGTSRYHRSSRASVAVFALSETSSGYAGASHQDINHLDVRSVGETAIDKALRGQNPVTLEPCEIDVILEPEALAEILEWMGWVTFGSREYLDGMSCLKGNEGTRITGDNITIYDDGNDPDELAAANPFDAEGVARRRVSFIEGGVAGAPVYDLLTAGEAGTESTGHAPFAFGDEPAEGGMPENIIMGPGDSTVPEMMASINRGVWVTRFHYVNGLLDPRRVLMTGMTRDGTFMIEDGRLTRGIKNMRFEEPFLEALGRAEMISRKRKAIPNWWGGTGGVVCPWVLIRGFRFIGVQEE